MELISDPVFGEVSLEASAEQLASLADAIVLGAGFIASDAGSSSVSGIVVVAGIEEGAESSRPGVRVDHDPERRVLVITGDAESRNLLAANLQAVATADDGYHLHIDYFPDHPYLVEGSVPLVVSVKPRQP